MYKLMFGVDNLDIRRKKPVRNEDVSKAFNEGSDQGEDTFEEEKEAFKIDPVTKKADFPQSIPLKTTIPNPSSISLNHTTFSGTRQLVQLKDSKLSLANKTMDEGE